MVSYLCHILLVRTKSHTKKVITQRYEAPGVGYPRGWPQSLSITQPGMYYDDNTVATTCGILPKAGGGGAGILTEFPGSRA